MFWITADVSPPSEFAARMKEGMWGSLMTYAHRHDVVVIQFYHEGFSWYV